jgi:carbamoyl-phosphate synthase small subunit
MTKKALQEELDKVPDMDGLELASVVSTKEVYEVGDVNAALKIAVVDYGVKQNILTSLAQRGAYIKVFPAKTPVNE